MVKKSDLAWTAVGIGAVVLSGFLLYEKLKDLSWEQVVASYDAISVHHWVMAILCTVGAYVALAGYDRIALRHLGKQVSWPFVALCSFTTYALSHNIGASMFSGAVVRYRAYRTKGLQASDVGILVIFCSFTFSLGAMITGGISLLLEPDTVSRFTHLEPWVGTLIGASLLALVGFYVYGSWRHFKPLDWKGIHIVYPRLQVVGQQLLIGPLELLCAAGIIYFALPEANNPGYLVVLGVFLASFCLALASHAPGGLGVLEAAFITGLPDIPKPSVLVALLVFRGLYLLLPFIIAIFVVIAFELQQWRKTRQG